MRRRSTKLGLVVAGGCIVCMQEQGRKQIRLMGSWENTLISTCRPAAQGWEEQGTESRKYLDQKC